MHRSLRLIVHPENTASAKIQQPYASDKEAKVPDCSYSYNFGFDNRIPKDVKAPASHRLAMTNNVLHCFSLLSEESAGRITLKQAHSA
jgi:hypothetical protein